MKIAFFSNFLNHHQLPFCKAMVSRLGERFAFVATEPFNQGVVSKGYEDMNRSFSFVLRSYESKESYQEAMELALHADVAIFGSAPEQFMRERLKNNKRGITFRYSERVFKQNEGKIIYYFGFFCSCFRNYINSITKRFYLLAASAYAPFDFARIGYLKNKMYKWGYFPRVSDFSLDELQRKKQEKVRLIWVGRMLDWKHPEQAIQLAKRLSDDRLEFDLRIIGQGPLQDEIKNSIKQMNLEHCVNCVGSLSAEQVREEMEKADIHLFTSDYNEGWGAVLNESMASACVPVACAMTGAVPFLIEHESNGYAYDGTAEELYYFVKKLLDDKEKRQKMQERAYATITECWNADNAADNLLLLSEHLINKESQFPIAKGPGSRASYVRQDSMLDRIREACEM